MKTKRIFLHQRVVKRTSNLYKVNKFL